MINVDHHHDNPRFGNVNLVVPDASSTGEVLADLFGELDLALTPQIAEALYIALVTDTGRFQYANTTPKALRLAADLVEAGADVHRVFQGVYENVQFAKLKLLARALERAQVLEGGEIVVSHLVRGDFEAVGATEPYSEGIIDVLRSVEGSLVSALIREPPRDGAPPRKVSLRSSVDEVDVSAIARKSGGGGHREAAGFSSDLSVEEITDFIVREVSAQVGSAAERGACPESESGRHTGVRRRDAASSVVDMPSSPCVLASHRLPRVSTAPTLRQAPSAAPRAASERSHPRRQARRADVVRDRRRDAAADEGADGACGNARSVRDRAPAAPVGCRDAGCSRSSSVCRSATRPRSTSPRGRRPATSTVSGSTSTSSPAADELEAGLDGLRGAVELPIPAVSAVKIDGERAYALHRRGVAVEMPVRTMHVHELTLVGYADGVVGLELHVSSGTYVRAIAEALGGHCTALRRTEIGPFHVEESDPERIIPPDEALARLP